VLDPETTAFVESGCALIVGTVAADGEPHAVDTVLRLDEVGSRDG